MSDFAVFVEGGLSLGLDELDNAKRRAAMSKAINKIARDARASAAKRILREIALPGNYVQGDRLKVTDFATRNRLEATITARARNTSLARFVTSSPKIGKSGVTLEVARGKARFMKRAFLIKLRQGTSPITDSKFNLGLAIRLRPGESLRNKYASQRVSKGLYVLYGPSVDQIFRNNAGSGVADDIAPEFADRLENEFLRLLGI